MNKKPVYLTVMVIVLMGVLGASFNVHKVEAPYPIIYIKADGSIDPPTANITSFDNVTYTLTADINASIDVQRENIVVDGAGYTVQGTGRGNGIGLGYRNNVTIKNVEVAGFWNGIYLDTSSNNNLTGNIVSNNGDGIGLYRSNYNILMNNTAASNADGIYLSYSHNNTLTGNVASSNNNNGIHLTWSRNNTLTGNIASNNRYSFGVSGGHFFDFDQSVDTSNRVDEQPIYYLIDEADVIIDAEANAGTVYLINCNNVTTRDLSLTKNYCGAMLFNTTNSKIENVTSNNNRDGICLRNSGNNTLTDNTICSNYNVGIILQSSSDNAIFHNSFVNNFLQASTSLVNVWDDGYPSGGNYWSDYTGVDEKSGLNQDQSGSDGIGDTPYVIDGNNQDNYPLIPEHDLAASVTAPFSLYLGGSLLLNATVTNRGSSDATSVELVLLINGTTADSATIPVLQRGDSFTLMYRWTPALEGTYNVTAQVPPLPEEVNKGNNQATKLVTVHAPDCTRTIYINADGSINPSDAPMQRDGDLYTLLGNVTPTWPYDAGIEISRGNITVDGAGYTVQGEGAYAEQIGIDIHMHVSNVTIKNMNVRGFCYGILAGGGGYDVCHHSITISRNTIMNNAYYGIHLYHCVNTTVWGNTIANNGEQGIHLGGMGQASNSIFYHNNFINNTKHVDTWEEAIWDNGYPSGGNYWDDYTGVDANNDGIGDTPHDISSWGYDNLDRYPLINPWTPSWEPSPQPSPPPSPPDVQVGVEAGDWIKCDYTVTGWPSGTPYPEWLKVEILSVEGTICTVRVTMHMSNGTELSDTLSVDVVAGGGDFQGLSGFVIPANCTTGDSIYMSGYGNVTIDGETTRTCAGVSRTVVHASLSQYGIQLTYYWDKETGIMVEASTISGSMTGIAKATETNMWQATPLWMQWWFYAIVAGAIVALAGGVYFLRRRGKASTSTASIPETEG